MGFHRKKVIFADHFAASNGGHCAAKWHSYAKIGFAAAKYPAEWSFGCEIGNFCVLELRSCEMGAPVLRSGTRVQKSVSQSQLSCEMVSQRMVAFVETC